MAANPADFLYDVEFDEDDDDNAKVKTNKKGSDGEDESTVYDLHYTQLLLVLCFFCCFFRKKCD